MYTLNAHDIRVLFSHMSDGASRLDINGNYTYVSEPYAQTLGYEPNELIGLSWRVSVHPDDHASMQKAYEHMLEKCQVVKKVRGVRKDGSIFFKEVKMLLATSDTGEFDGHYCIANDVTAKIALKNTRKHFENLYRQTPAAIHSINEQGEITSVSDKWLAMLGYEREEVIGRKSISFLTKESQEKAKVNIQKFFQYDYPHEFYYQMQKKDGQLIDVILQAVAERPKHPADTFRAHALIRDVTTLNQEEKIVKTFYEIGASDSLSLEKRTQCILKMGLEHLGLEFGLISSIKGAAYRVDYAASLVENMSIEPGTCFDLKDTYCDRCYGSNGVLAYHNASVDDLSTLPCYKKFQLNSYIGCPIYVNGDAYGTISFSARGERNYPFSDREKSFVQFMAQWIGSEIARSTFIDKLKQSESTLSKAVDHLKKSNEALENFAYICSHDLQEPLRMVRAFSAKITENTALSMDERRYLSYVQKGAKTAQELVNELLAYARLTKTPDRKMRW